MQMKFWSLRKVFTFGSLLLVGCSQTVEEKSKAVEKSNAPAQQKKTTDTAPAREKQNFVLATEPAGAKGILEVKKDLKEGETEVVLAGTIGGRAKDVLSADRAMFLLTDDSLKPCGKDEGCPTPWDYCCNDNGDLKKAQVSVKMVDASGATVKTGARELLGLKELQKVVVKGKIKKESDGSVVVLATGVFVKS